MKIIVNAVTLFNAIMQKPIPAIDLMIRLTVADVFWKSGLNKIQSWDSTLMLFEYEYAVPLLSPYIAAVIGTVAELLLPVLLVLGLGSRFAAAALFLVNIVAIISYPDLSDSGRQFHILWGMLLAVTATHGAGCISLDAIIKRILKSRHPYCAGNL